VIHRKKNRPALQRRDISTVSLVSFLSLFFSFLLPPSPSPRPLFHREFASVFFYPVFSGSVIYSILYSSVLFKTLCFRAFR